MAKYKKKRARELRQDKFRDATMVFFDRLSQRLEGKGRAILQGLAGALLVGIVIWVGVSRHRKHANEAQAALGRAIRITTASVSSTSSGSEGELKFSSEQERAQRAIDEFQKVAAKYGDPYRAEARYFIAANLLYVDRGKGVSDLTELAKSSISYVATLSKFALAQANETDGKYDAAAAIYLDLAKQNSTVITPETANLRLAMVYEKQGKKKEAADLLFNLVDGARKARDAEGKPLAQSQAARDAAKELQKLDPDRYAQLPPEAPSLGF